MEIDLQCISEPASEGFFFQTDGPVSLVLSHMHAEHQRHTCIGTCSLSSIFCMLMEETKKISVLNALPILCTLYDLYGSMCVDVLVFTAMPKENLPVALLLYFFTRNL